MTARSTIARCSVPLMFVAAVSIAWAFQDAGTIRILTPAAGSVLSGRTVLAAGVTPAGLAVRGVTFFVDGHEVCRVAARPFQCEWDAGHQTNARSVRAVADLADGRRLVDAVRTPDGPKVFTAAADAVFVPVHVTDSRNHGHVPERLDRNSFQLLEDGVPQDISTVLVEDTPIHVFLALDVSGSMTMALPELRKAAGGFLRSLRPQDAITLAAFNDTMALLAPPASALPAAVAAVTRLQPTSGATAFYDALIRAIGVLKLQPSPRAIVAFTDGDDDASHSTIVTVRTALQTNDVALYLIAQGKAAEDKALRDQLSMLATETGGAAWFAPNMSDLEEHFSRVTKDLTGEYVIGYSPKKPLGDGGWRRIAIEVAGEQGRYDVRAREGYLAVSRDQ